VAPAQLPTAHDPVLVAQTIESGMLTTQLASASLLWGASGIAPVHRRRAVETWGLLGIFSVTMTSKLTQFMLLQTCHHCSVL
jgi:hypothetical protein